MDLGLAGRRALVTGASRGIGRAIATTLAREGCALALCARGLADLEAAAVALRPVTRVFTEAFDVADGAALHAFVDRAAGALGGLDIVVSTVSAGNVKGEDAWERSFRTDLAAFVALVTASLPHLQRSDQASIVVIGTTNASDTARPASANSYSAVKAAVVQHAAALARALAGDGVRVNIASPGPIEFPGGAWEKIARERPQVYQEVLGRVPLRRLGRAEEVADAVAFLASPRAAFCVGVNLVVDGGMLSRVQH